MLFWDELESPPCCLGRSFESVVSESEDLLDLMENGNDVLDDSMVRLLRCLHQPGGDGLLNKGRKVGRHAATIDRPISIMLQ